MNYHWLLKLIENADNQWLHSFAVVPVYSNNFDGLLLTIQLTGHLSPTNSATALENKYCKKIVKEHFNKNLIMSEEEEHLFQQSNSCWICGKIINDEDEKVRDHCHVTGKFRGVSTLELQHKLSAD